MSQGDDSEHVSVDPIIGIETATKNVIAWRYVVSIGAAVLAVLNLSGDDPDGWDRTTGGIFAFIAGLSLAWGQADVFYRKAVARHRDAQHPGADIPHKNW